MVSITSFTDDSDEDVFLCWLSWFLLDIVPLSYFAQKAFNGFNTYQHIFTWSNLIGCLEWKGSHWEHIVIVLLLWNLSLQLFPFWVCCVGIFAWNLLLLLFVQLSWRRGPLHLQHWSVFFMVFTSVIHHVFGCWFPSAVALCLFFTSTDIMNIPGTLFHCPPLHASVSHNAVFELPTVETIDYCIMVSTICWNARHVRSVVYFRQELTSIV